MNQFANKRIGIIGAGKRFFNVYQKILENLECKILIWNRTKSKIAHLESQKHYQIIDNLNDFSNAELDLCLTFLPNNISYDVIGNLNLGCNLLIETPVTDQRWLSKEKVGVLEQWIYLPVEQMKEIIYKNKIISRPYFVFNDGRSFDYHAIAQLRKYTQHKKPLLFYGKMQQIQNQFGFIDKNNKINYTPDDWLHGVTTLEDNVVLMHSFTYNCKMTKLKAAQLLRCTSIDGSLISGRTHQMDNDYERFELRYLTDDRKVNIAKINRIESEDKFIGLQVDNQLNFVSWKNKYKDLQFSDQQIAIADLLLDALVSNLYTPRESYIDYVTIIGMKQSSIKNNVLGV